MRWKPEKALEITQLGGFLSQSGFSGWTATSRDGEAAVEAVRKKARKARGEGTNLDTCRLRIDRAVKASLDRN